MIVLYMIWLCVGPRRRRMRLLLRRLFMALCKVRCGSSYILLLLKAAPQHATHSYPYAVHTHKKWRSLHAKVKHQTRTNHWIITELRATTHTQHKTRIVKKRCVLKIKARVYSKSPTTSPYTNRTVQQQQQRPACDRFWIWPLPLPPPPSKRGKMLAKKEEDEVCNILLRWFVVWSAHAKRTAGTNRTLSRFEFVHEGA